MGLNRMMMKSNKVLKDITAEMVPVLSDDWNRLGFIDGSVGQLSPNPLPNGVRVSAVALLSDGTMQLLPPSIKSCTFEEIGATLKHGDMDNDNINLIGQYLVDNVGSHIPITFHF